MTTDKGPWVEDVFFVLETKHGERCVVDNELAAAGGLLEALQAQLEGLDNAAVIEAMGSAANCELTIWEAASDASDS